MNKKRLTPAQIAVILLGTLMGIWRGVLLTQSRSNAGPSAAPGAATGVSAVTQPRSMSIQQALKVAARGSTGFGFPIYNVPGRLVGSWHSRSVSGNAGDTTGDTLAGVQLVGPNREQLQSLDHPSEGTFDLRIELPGYYTFHFDNRTNTGSSAKLIDLDARYQAD
jgi:hypothetical protein